MDTKSAMKRLGALTVIGAIMAAGCGGATTPDQTVRPGATTSPAPATPSPTVAPTVTATPATAVDFTPGTVAAPRIVELTVDDSLNFVPGVVPAVLAETVTFRIRNVGTAVHEFMIGKLDAAFADLEGTPEVADIAGGQTSELTFTFSGAGPFAFACHAPGHFEHGMLGYVQLVGPGAPTIGTAADPRVVWLTMDDTLRFTPSVVTVTKGETIRFVVTNGGTAVHEIQVGPADKVAADEVDGVLVIEKDELDAGSTHALDYTFDGDGPYAFACHEPGHYEAGMMGTIELIGG